MWYPQQPDDKHYPKPTKAATQRAYAHLKMSEALGLLAEKHKLSPDTVQRVIKEEGYRQYRMVNNYRRHYGDNAEV